MSAGRVNPETVLALAYVPTPEAEIRAMPPPAWSTPVAGRNLKTEIQIARGIRCNGSIDFHVGVVTGLVREVIR